ncbi:MAG: ABC transporter ATP-binding protein [Mycoplasmataceae bacterium]|nr:ABC transporter ATP-binding protein [Mycoplasmataceae bacterium]
MENRFAVKNKSKITNKRVLYVKDLFVSFGKGKNKKQVLKGITFDLREGETLSLIGANGAGKTVLMESMLGLIKKDSGKVYLNLGNKKFIDDLREVGIQFQSSVFAKRAKVKGVINFYRKLYKNKTTQDEVNRMIQIFGVSEFLNQKMNKLSGGQKQRVNLLVAIIHKPKIMILDEFITGLDVKSVRNIITFVNNFKVENNASMIIISHQPEEIEELSDRVLVLNNGKIIREIYIPEIYDEYGSVAAFVEKII